MDDAAFPAQAGSDEGGWRVGAGRDRRVQQRNPACQAPMQRFQAGRPEVWAEDIGEG